MEKQQIYCRNQTTDNGKCLFVCFYRWYASKVDFRPVEFSRKPIHKKALRQNRLKMNLTNTEKKQIVYRQKRKKIRLFICKLCLFLAIVCVSIWINLISRLRPLWNNSTLTSQQDIHSIFVVYVVLWGLVNSVPAFELIVCNLTLYRISYHWFF